MSQQQRQSKPEYFYCITTNTMTVQYDANHGLIGPPQASLSPLSIRLQTSTRTFLDSHKLKTSPPTLRLLTLIMLWKKRISYCCWAYVSIYSTVEPWAPLRVLQQLWPHFGPIEEKNVDNDDLNDGDSCGEYGKPGTGWSAPRGSILGSLSSAQDSATMVASASVNLAIRRRRLQRGGRRIKQRKGAVA